MDWDVFVRGSEIMSNKKLTSIAIISLLLNVIVVFSSIIRTVNAEITSISIPPLIKDSGYVLQIPNGSYTCIEMEGKLGLQRGDIVNISFNSKDGTIITFNKGVNLDSVKVQNAVNIIKGMTPSISIK